MLNTNLLPPAEKLSLAYELRTRALLAVASGLGALLVIGLALLLPTIFFLGFVKSEVVRSLDLAQRQADQAGLSADADRIENANHRADSVLHHADATASVSSKINSLIQAVPSAVAFSSLSYQAKSREIVIQGSSPTRSAFLQFLDALGKVPVVANVSSPISNVIRETNVAFSVTVALR